MLTTESSFFLRSDQHLVALKIMRILTVLIASVLLPTTAITLSNQSSAKIIHLPIISETLQLTSNIIVESDGAAINRVHLTLANVAKKTVVPLNQVSLSVRYRDAQQQIGTLPWSWELQGNHNGDRVLDYGERVQISVDLQDALATPLTTNQPFVLEFKPARGAILTVYRTTPQLLTSLIDLQ